MSHEASEVGRDIFPLIVFELINELLEEGIFSVVTGSHRMTDVDPSPEYFFYRVIMQ
jgi:hypothetical protein